ncbi:MAG TPA: endolytic transglycosylase MltG [Kofleriaceae bacterium]|jgi:UPF0755 protein|nr:endolytic transglycosylase MltG [Kofleriaceae bacterium]
MSKKSFRIALIVVASTLVVGLVVAGWFAWQIREYPNTRRAGRGAEIVVKVKPRTPFIKVAAQLREQGVIDRPFWFRIYAMRRGATDAIKPGDHVLRDNMTPKEVLDQLVEPVPEKTASVTLPEGQNMLEYFALFEQAGIAKAAELEALARSPEFLQKLGLAGDNIDGYLFPDTYKFVVPTAPAKVLERLVVAHRTVWTQLVREHGKALGKLKDRLKWSDRDVLILASIVEKEAVEPAERPRIAQVFVNRLTSPSFKPKRLETDPTIRYGCLVPVQKSAACIKWNEPCLAQNLPVGCERLRRLQLDDRDNPYNTYQHEGLPPGPISNPGRASLAATMNPDGSDYFFFVAKNPREHVFSKTLAEHQKAVDQYQR